MVFQNIFLLVGSNLGDRLSNLNKCADLIEAQIGTVIKRSKIYETAPWGKTDQPNFMNQALQIESVLKPRELLAACLSVERTFGRMRDEKWAARTLDIDIIYFDNKIITTEDLTIPHPRIAERKFVLLPISEIAPEFVHPSAKKTNRELLAECPDPLLVKPVIT